MPDPVEPGFEGTSDSTRSAARARMHHRLTRLFQHPANISIPV